MPRFVRIRPFLTLLALICGTSLISGTSVTFAAESWVQFQGNAGHSGNAPGRSLSDELGLIAAVPLSDAVLTAPVVAERRVYIVDGSGVAWCIEAETGKVVWKFASPGGKANCNNVSSPAIAGDHLHFGTMGGRYYVLDRKSGAVVREIETGDPIFSTPVVVEDRVYFVTLGSRVHAVTHDGQPRWMWDYVTEEMNFEGDRWSGVDWMKHAKGRVTWKDQFMCARNMAAHGKTLVIPAGGKTVFLRDAGDHPEVRAIGIIPNQHGNEYPACFGLSLDDDGIVYQQWHRRDNAGRVEKLKLTDDGKVVTDWVRGTNTAINLPGHMSFCSVAIRGDDVYRVRPEQGLEFCRHEPNRSRPVSLGGFPSVCPPVLLKNQAVYGGLDGKLYVVPLDGKGEPKAYPTGFGKAITAGVAVCDGRAIFGSDDGYLYIYGPGGSAELPRQSLDIAQIRSPLTGDKAGAEYDWYTNYGNQEGNNSTTSQGIEPPLRLKWIRPYKGTFKHIPVCGGGRMYTHTAEGQVFAVEQETGRLLWRRYFPNVYLSFTSPIYRDGKLLVPQAGMKESQLRCFDAATGELLWQAPFTGSPSWSRQAAPVVHENLAIYMFGTGKYDHQGSDKAWVFGGKPVARPDGGEVMSWMYTHNNPYYPSDNKPLLRAWNLDTGEVVWKQDFSDLGSGGNDCGICLMDGTLYYSTFFGYKPKSGANGVTAALDPNTGKVLWKNTKYSVTAGCMLSGDDGRLYLGGYNPQNEKLDYRCVRCLDAEDGSLIWESPPLKAAINVVTVGDDFVFANAYGRNCYVLDKKTGKIESEFETGYSCTRFTVADSFVMGSNMDMFDLENGNRLVSSGPCVDARECVGASVSNGRIFYSSQASGLQVSQLAGAEAKNFTPLWKK